MSDVQHKLNQNTVAKNPRTLTDQANLLPRELDQTNIKIQKANMSKTK